jgi:hypothetical protein
MEPPLVCACIVATFHGFSKVTAEWLSKVRETNNIK